MKKVTMVLEDLTCPSCINKIQKNVEQQEGTADVQVLFNASKVKFTLDEQQNSVEAIQKTIEKIGYLVKMVQVG